MVVDLETSVAPAVNLEVFAIDLDCFVVDLEASVVHDVVDIAAYVVDRDVRRPEICRERRYPNGCGTA